MNALSGFQRLLTHFLSVVVIMALDQATKLFFNSYLVYGVPQAIFPGFNLTLLHNTGAAFSLWANGSPWHSGFLLMVSIGVCIAIVVWLLRQRHTYSVLAIGLTLILAGALSNLIDRMVLGYVVDFLDFYVGSWHWPAFNVADSSVVIGAILVVWASWR